jgi:hypothetical protein
MIIEAFSSDKLPKCHMSVRNIFSIDSRMGADSGLRYVKRDLARALAEQIMEEERLFKTESFGPTGQELIGVILDCIVVSESELRGLIHDAFLRGMDAGRRGA